MNIETVRAFLGWGAILNIAFLSLWFFLFVFAHGFIINMHRRWFAFPRETFDAIHYAGMAVYKISIWFCFIIPYLVLRFCL